MNPPSHVAGYRLVRELGKGGMGVVFEAERDGRSFALKLLGLDADAEARLRFQREAESQARVDAHPNVVRIHDAGIDGTRAYLVMDLLGGDTLERKLQGGPLPWREALTLVRDLAAGLAHVHAQGVLHRDIKPANVLFDERGVPHLADFGLARLEGARSLTESGTLMGTPAYMPPEQIDTARVDARADVYSLGAVLFHCLTGRPPYDASGGALSQLTKIVSDPVPALDRDGLPGGLERLAQRVLAKDPSARPQTARALALELELLLAGDTRSPGPRASSASLWVAASVGIALGGALVLGALKAREGSPRPQASRSPIAAAPSPAEPIAQPLAPDLPSRVPEGITRERALRLAEQVAPPERARLLDLLDGDSAPRRLTLSRELLHELFRDHVRAATAHAGTLPPLPPSEAAVWRRLLVVVRLCEPERSSNSASTLLRYGAQRELQLAVFPSGRIDPLWAPRVRGYCEQLKALYGAGSTQAFSAEEEKERIGQRPWSVFAEPWEDEALPLAAQRSCRESLVIFLPGHWLAWDELGFALQRWGRDRLAERCFRRAVALRPKHGAPHLYLGRFLVERERWSEAIDVLRASVRWSQTLAKSRTKVLYLLACAQLGGGDPFEANKTLQRLEGREPYKNLWNPTRSVRYWSLKARLCEALASESKGAKASDLLRQAKDARDRALRAKHF